MANRVGWCHNSFMDISSIAGVPVPSFPVLPVDPSLAMGGASVAGPLMAGCLDPSIFQPQPSMAGKSSTVVVAEGVSPVSCQLVDKISGST